MHFYMHHWWTNPKNIKHGATAPHYYRKQEIGGRYHPLSWMESWKMAKDTIAVTRKESVQ
jgi:hypothetical protein